MKAKIKENYTIKEILKQFIVLNLVTETAHLTPKWRKK